MFDGLEMGLFPLVARPALLELLGKDSVGEVGRWTAWITAAFLVGAAGGGLLFGWLGDRIGRVRAMIYSVLTYAIFSGACGFAESPRKSSDCGCWRRWAWGANGRWAWRW